MTLTAQKITITAIDPAGPSVKCKHAGGLSTHTSTSGWQFTQLPRRQSMTEFMGYDGYTLTVPVMFGDGVDTTSIEPQLEVLRGIARNLVGPRVEPAVVKIDCPAVPLTWLKWTINDLKFNSEYRDNDGSRYYAQIDITFFEWQPTALVLTKTGKSATQLLAASTAATSSTSPATKLTSTPVVTSTGIKNAAPTTNFSVIPPSGSTYVVKKGDTLETIAKAKLGNANLWKSIASLNVDVKTGGPIRDPKSIEVGQVLRMPKGASPDKDNAPIPGVNAGSNSLPTPTSGPGSPGFGIVT